MGLLRTQLLLLKERFDQGKIVFLQEFINSESGKNLISDLEKVSLLPNGEIDLETCSNRVRSFARMVYLQGEEPSAPSVEEVQVSQIPPSTVSSLMKEYFDLLDSFFQECAGFKAEKFAAIEFESVFAANRSQFVSRAEEIRKALESYLPRITEFFGKNHKVLYESSKNLHGVKCVVGGTSRFPLPLLME
jgi:hypothetical protein